MQIVTKRKVFEVGEKTLIMGILNVTPDSFSDGGKYTNGSSSLKQVEKMISEGADIIDIGGESTRPGAKKISLDEELTRVMPIIAAIRKENDDIVLSIDTYKAAVAKESVIQGVDIINDVSGLQMDADMPKTVATLSVPIIINHMRGVPQTMQDGEIMYRDVIGDISDFFERQIKTVEAEGVTEENIILDPGFGFGKTVEQNLTILKRLGEFQKFAMPLLIGISRKSTIEKILAEEFDMPNKSTERLEGSLAATAVAALHGVNIVRTHDILETKKFLTVLDKIKNI